MNKSNTNLHLMGVVCICASILKKVLKMENALGVGQVRAGELGTGNWGNKKC